MAFKQPYNNFNKQGASIAPAAAAAPAAAKGIGALLAKLGIGKAAAAKGGKVALSKGGSFLAKLGKGKASSLVGPTQPKQGFIKQASSKISKGYNQKISDIAKNLGTDYDNVDKFVKTSATNLGNTVASKISSKKEEDEVIPSYSSGKTTIINTTNNKFHGYVNPQGPSQGYSDPAKISKSDQALNAITPKKNDFISNFHAPVNVQGITFDAGDAVRAGRLLYDIIKDKNTEKKAFKSLLAPEKLSPIKELKNIESEAYKRQSLPKATVANASMPNRSNKISIEKIKGKDYKVVDNLDGLGMPEIPSLVKKDKNSISRSSSINTTSYADIKKDNSILNSKSPLSKTKNKTSKKLKRKFKKDKNLMAVKS